MSPRGAQAGMGDASPRKSPRGQPAIPEDAEAEAEAEADLEAAAGPGEVAEGQLRVQDAVPAKKPAERWWPKVQHAVKRVVEHPGDSSPTQQHASWQCHGLLTGLPLITPGACNASG